MKVIGTKQIRVGMIIKFEKELWKVLEAHHGTPGNLGAFMQVKLRHITKGNQTQHKFRTAENVEQISLDVKPVEFLYQDGDDYHFMDTETYDQFTLSKDILDQRAVFLQPNMQLQLETYEGTPIGVSFPKTVQLKVAECEPHIKSATATSSFKQATLENGATTQVPGFISEGELIEINTDDGSYVGRVKN
ncbi:MAG: elongation factor P [Bdellovibrionales bacterium]|nr:elongation factor P [Bdellovibrionales bacterium]